MAINSKGRQEAERLYRSGWSLADIAEKLNISYGTVRTWKNRYKWVQEVKRNKTEKTVSKTVSKIIESKPDELTEKEELFCQEYIRRFNATQSYLRAFGGKRTTAGTEGHNLLKKPKIQNRIKSLKEMQCEEHFLTEDDIVQHYIDIAFADVDDFVVHGTTKIKDEDGIEQEIEFTNLREAGEYDGQLVSHIRMGRFGPEIQPPTVSEKMKALEWLSTHLFDMQTSGDKVRIESLKSKIEVEQERLQLAKDAVW